MPSPFPGMNPYLEQPSAWHDFHERFCPLVAESITAQVRPHYIVKIDEHVYIHELPGQRRLLSRGDVAVVRSPRESTSGNAASAVASAPHQVDVVGVDFERLSFIEVRDRDSDRI